MKLIAIDLDRTLLNDDHVISAENRAALKKASEQDVVAVMTDRTLMTTRTLLGSDLKVPVIAANGAVVFDHNDRLIGEKPLPADETCEMIEYADFHHLYYEVTMAGKLLSPPDSRMLLANELKQSGENLTPRTALAAWNDAERRFSQAGWAPFSEVKTLIRHGKAAYKLLIYSYNRRALRGFKNRFTEMPNVRCTRAVGRILEFVSDQVKKGRMLRFLTDYYGLKCEDTIVFDGSSNGGHIAGEAMRRLVCHAVL
ncbi:MAG: HAD hydrolase family protein [Sporolactobacillus sp.]|jgi:hydroxymethylpyrimidine pyrophosphatase-like HAD family hydrolase|nr:HAD hydrolase family protein [Sporolactobacillus sp.]